MVLASTTSVTPGLRSSGPVRKAFRAPSDFSTTACPFGQVSIACWMRPVSSLASSASASVLLRHRRRRVSPSTRRNLAGITGSVTLRVSCAWAASVRLNAARISKLPGGSHLHATKNSGLMWRSNRFSVTLREMLASQVIQHLEVLVAHLGGYLEAHMQELAQVRIETRILLVVTQRGCILLGGPSVDRGGVGQLRVIDVDHGRIRLAQGVAIFKSFGVHLLCQVEALAAGFGESDQFFQPGGTRGLEMDSGCQLNFWRARRMGA